MTMVSVITPQANSNEYNSSIVKLRRVPSEQNVGGITLIENGPTQVVLQIPAGLRVGDIGPDRKAHRV
jgi:hypothetical protein